MSKFRRIPGCFDVIHGDDFEASAPIECGGQFFGTINGSIDPDTLTYTLSGAGRYRVRKLHR